jgi:hypothetical protein
VREPKNRTDFFQRHDAVAAGFPFFWHVGPADDVLGVWHSTWESRWFFTGQQPKFSSVELNSTETLFSVTAARCFFDNVPFNSVSMASACVRACVRARARARAGDVRETSIRVAAVSRKTLRSVASTCNRANCFGDGSVCVGDLG